MQPIQIHWTTDNLDEARRVGRLLLKEQLAACVQIIPWIESMYLWDGNLETSQETKVMIKTRLACYESICQIIDKEAQYELPEITYTLIDGGSTEYLNWMNEMTSQPSEKKSL